jgi:hypothetical protein
VLEYEFFSAASDLSLLVIEGALRVRFLEFYEGRVPVVGRRKKLKGAEATLLARAFDDVWRASRDWQLRPTTGSRTYPLPTGLEALLAWARREALLPGRRTRGVDKAIVNLRNWAAHPTSYTLQMPPSSARALRQTAEIINKLWGNDTPEGRLFQGPIERTPRVVGISADGTETVEVRLDQVPELTGSDTSYEFGVFLAAAPDELTRFGSGGAGMTFAYQAGLQETYFPCELLYRGDLNELVRKLDTGAFADSVDSVEFLDRVFFIRTLDGDTDPARSREDVASLRAPLEGRWHVIIADSPFDARQHVAHHAEVVLEDDTCPACFVGVEADFEDWAQLSEFLAN